MARRVAPPATPPPADAGAIAAALDALVRDVLPEALEREQFGELAARVRALDAVTPATDPGTLRALARELRFAVFDESLRLAALASSLDDDLERLRARARANDRRFQRAANALSLALEVAAAWALGLDDYRAGLTRDRVGEIALSQISDTVRLLAN